MLTDEGDIVLDPFAGSCVTGEVCERLRRQWLCVELQELYLKGAKGRFGAESLEGKAERASSPAQRSGLGPASYFRIPRVGLLWERRTGDKLPARGGRKRKGRRGKAHSQRGRGG